ncbi:MAG: HupE/UreJ family protein [Longimicrobiales bacterium]|nr:HupE/UreJ family protein [Longimicrobiales bacterium]
MKASSLFRSGRARTGFVALLAALLLLGSPEEPAAHEIPVDVTIRTFIHPEDGTLRFLVRVPLSAMRDFQWPLEGPGFLDLDRARPMLRDAVQIWIRDYVTFYENGEPLPLGEIAAVRVSRPGSNRTFNEYEDALAHVTGPPLGDDVQLIWDQAMLDALLEYPIESATSDFSLEPTLAHLGLETTTILRFVTPEGETRAYQYHGDPGLLRLDPSWYHAALQFTESGIYHILIGLDHLLFLLCLIIPFRSLRGLIPVVTAFTVAHSVTLIASALGMAPNALWFPPFIETLIALSIVYMAIENMVGAKLQRRWLVTFGFGLIHGFGFSFVLAEQLQFAGSHLLTSLLAFNVGVEIGQILVLLAVVPLLELFFRYGVKERVGNIILSVLVAHTAWHWFTDRGSALLQYQFRMPALTPQFWAGVMRWLMLALIVGGIAWLMWELFNRWKLGTDTTGEQPEVEAGAGAGGGFGD